MFEALHTTPHHAHRAGLALPGCLTHWVTCLHTLHCTGTGQIPRYVQTMECIHDIISIIYLYYLFHIYNIVCGMCNVWGVCSCCVAPAPPMTPRCPAEPAAAAHSCGQLRGKSAAAPRTAPALTSPLHNRDVPWPQPPHGQIWSRHRQPRRRGPAEWQ